MAIVTKMNLDCRCILIHFIALVLSAVRWQVSNQQAQVATSAPSSNPLLQTQLSNIQGNRIEPLLRAAFAAAPNVATSFNLNQAQESPQIPVAQPTIGQNYGSEDPIIYLDYSSFTDEILRRRTANFVYFNANFSHCRNCHKFFEIWKELAIDIRWWRHIIRLSSINCSDEDNIDMCRRAGVTQFPQVRYYWVMSNSLEQDGQRIRILGKSVHAMRHLIMDKVLDSYIEHNKILSRSKQTVTNPSGSSTAGQTPANPLLSLMSPMINQLLSGSGSNGLSTIINSLSSKGGIAQLSSLIGGGQGLSQIMNALISAGNIRQRLNTQPLPGNWPDLEPLEAQDTTQLINMLPLDQGKNVGALLIMETSEFLYTGLEVMLDLNPYANQTYIVRVKDERSIMSKNLTKRDDVQAPALIFVGSNREPKLLITAPKYTNDEDLRRVFVRTFEKRQIKYPVKRAWTFPANNEIRKAGQVESPEDEELLSRVNQVYMNDLTNAIRISLMEQVLKHPDLSDDQYNALVKYVYTLINYFPFVNDESLRFLKRLHTWLQNQVSPIDVNEYKKQLHDIDEALQQRDWVACKSLSNTKSIPATSRKSVSLFENPAQIGKVVSNITRYLRTQQRQADKLKSLFTAFTSNITPSPKTLPANTTISQSTSHVSILNSSSTVAPRTIKEEPNDSNESPIERIIKSLTNGSLGSDSSILRLISGALTGGRNGDAAKGKSKFAREYPCGAWKLAHVMVVNEYLKDSPRKDVRHIVLHSLYQYMLHFYACPTCGNRVSDVSAEFRLNLNENLKDPADSVLLLWKVHNRVNKRLEAELRPGSPPKLQFPPESLCPKCRAARAQNDLLSTPNWHERQVLNFLVHHYRPKNLFANSNSSVSSSANGSMFVADPMYLSTTSRRSICQLVLWMFSYWLFYLKLGQRNLLAGTN